MLFQKTVIENCILLHKKIQPATVASRTRHLVGWQVLMSSPVLIELDTIMLCFLFSCVQTKFCRES